MADAGSANQLFELWRDRKSTRLNSSHLVISYAVFCLKKKKLPSRVNTALVVMSFFFFFNDTATTEIYTLSLHDALPIWSRAGWRPARSGTRAADGEPASCSLTRSVTNG